MGRSENCGLIFFIHRDTPKSDKLMLSILANSEFICISKKPMLAPPADQKSGSRPSKTSANWCMARRQSLIGILHFLAALRIAR